MPERYSQSGFSLCYENRTSACRANHLAPSKKALHQKHHFPRKAISILGIFSGFLCQSRVRLLPTSDYNIAMMPKSVCHLGQSLKRVLKLRIYSPEFSCSQRREIGPSSKVTQSLSRINYPLEEPIFSLLLIEGIKSKPLRFFSRVPNIKWHELCSSGVPSDFQWEVKIPDHFES